ncbi:MAG: ATP-binding protein [Chloroflexota bacterium]
MAESPTGIVTFLFTDIEGSTTRWERTPAAMSVALAYHDQVLRSSIESRGGTVFKTVGDAFCAAFSSSRDGLLAAVDAQRGLQSHPWEGIAPLRVRMALHTGAAEMRDDDYFGPSLNRVARIMSAGHGGQVLLSQVTADLVRDDLPDGIRLVDLGEHHLRDLDRPERLSQLAGVELLDSFPPLRGSTVRLNNLPSSRTRFVARDEELVSLRSLLLAERVTLVTLIGPGGTGKSRLALESARQLAEEFEHGVCFIPLAAVSDAQYVPIAIASAVGIPESAAVKPMDAVLGYLAEKQMLMVIDNFEQVLEAAGLVGELLARAPEVKLLVTSRAPLRVSGEREFPVVPLSVPSETGIGMLEMARRSPAVALFVDRATVARPGFMLDASNAVAIAEICRRVDGLPLAIELAAARIKLLPPAAMLARLDRRLKLLTGGARDLPERQQTLRSAIAWSYELLDESERRLFRRLSVFAGGCTLEAAEHVGMGPNDLEEMSPEILDLVASLLDKSLIRQEEGDDEGRFGMLHTIREFGLEQLAASAFDTDVRGRHAEFYLRLAESIAPRLTGPLQTESLRQLSMEHDNIREALEWYRTSGDTSMLARLVLAVWWFWYLRGHLLEGRHWLELSLTMLGDDDRGETVTRLHYALGAVAALQADVNLGVRVLDRGRELALELKNMELAARMLALRGQVAGASANQSDAVAMLERAEREQRQNGDLWGLALTLMFRSWRSWALRERKAAEQYALESTRIFDCLGDRWGAALSPSVLARLAMEEGRFDDARAHLDRASRRWTEAGHRWSLGHVLNGQGDIARMERDYEEAETRYHQSRAIFREFGNKNGLASVLHNLGYVRLHKHDPHSAEQLFQESLGLFQVLEDRRGVLECMAGLASAAAFSGNGERAVYLFGAVEGELDALGMVREGSNELDYQVGVARARTLIAPDAFEEHWERGRRLTYDQALAAATVGWRPSPTESESA